MANGWRTGLRNGLEVVELETAASTATIALQGAQVLSFAPRGDRDWLWVSERARWSAGVALRGGIPICFPWFGPHPTEKAFPAHGFVRTRLWRLLDVREAGADLRVELAFGADEQTRAQFPHPFEARLAVTIGAELELAFDVANLGDAPFAYEVALHSYLTVADAAAAAVEGLAGCAFVDKVAGGAPGRQDDGPLRIAGEVDRVYDSDGPVTLVDGAGGRAVRVTATGGRSTVVWNPAPDKTATLSDMAPDGYRRFVCIEAGAIGTRRIALPAGTRHALTVRYSGRDISVGR
jgi:glucose-6-phosphate 1-epimerase